MRICLVLVALTFSAVADVPTWICKQPNGTKAIQDHPCEGSTEVRQFSAATAPPPTLDQSLKRWTDHVSAQGQESRCRILLNNTRGAAYRHALAECRGQQ